MKKIAIAVPAAMMAAWAGSAAAAQDIPCSTARVVVPYGAGGGSDIHARVIVNAANRLGATPELQVVNITGQGGNTGAREVQEAPADGCTMLFQHEAILSSYLTNRVDFSWDGFTPVAMATVEPAIFAAGPSAPFDNLAEMQEYAAENPGEVRAAASLGSNTHFFLLMMQDELDIEFNIIGYEGGRERITALLADTVHVGQVGESDARQYFGGELKALGYFNDERSESIPDVPTAQEQGIDLEIASVRGFLLPPDAPEDITDHYAAIIEEALADPEVVEQIGDMGGIIRYMGPEEYSDWWREQGETWAAIADELGLR